MLSMKPFILYFNRHGGRFGQVFAASGKLFIELDKFKEQFKVWILPALVDLDTLFERELCEPQDWDVAFQAAKKRKEEVSTLSRCVRCLSFVGRILILILFKK